MSSSPFIPFLLVPQWVFVKLAMVVIDFCYRQLVPVTGQSSESFMHAFRLTLFSINSPTFHSDFVCLDPLSLLHFAGLVEVFLECLDLCSHFPP